MERTFPKWHDTAGKLLAALLGVACALLLDIPVQLLDGRLVVQVLGADAQQRCGSNSSRPAQLQPVPGVLGFREPWE